MSLRRKVIRLAHQNPEIRPALLRALVASDRSDLVWAIKELSDPFGMLEDVVDVLDRRDGGPSLADSHSEIARAVRDIRRGGDPGGRSLRGVLEGVLRKYR